LPSVMADARYVPYLAERIAVYDMKSKLAHEILSKIPEIIIHPAQGAFYMTAVFRTGALTSTQSFPLAAAARGVIAPYLEGVNLDQRFCYQLLAATGICIVPLSSGFNSDLFGFRFTLLEPDEKIFESTLRAIAQSIRIYLDS